MALPTMSASPKFLRLCHVVKRLGVSKPTMRGMLEQLWEAAHAQLSPVFRDALYVEASCEWDGDTGKLCEILVSEGWIDPCDGGLEIHNYWDHAPRWVREQARKRDEYAAKKSLGKASNDKNSSRSFAQEVAQVARICANSEPSSAKITKNCSHSARIPSCAFCEAKRSEEDKNNNRHDFLSVVPEVKKPDLTAYQKIEPVTRDALDILTKWLIAANQTKSRHWRPNPAMLAVWPVEFHDLMESREMTLQELASVLEWSQASDFWGPVIQSPTDLAKNLDKITAQMQRDKGGSVMGSRKPGQGHVDKFPDTATVM